MNSKGIDAIGSSLRELINERGIIARCELLNRVYGYVRTADLSPSDIEELQKNIGKNLAAGIFMNILSGAPIFFDLPKLDSYTTLNGRLFHFIHTQKYSRQDFDQAYRKFMELKPELKSLLADNLTHLLMEFMSEAGYKFAERADGRFRFEAPDRSAEVTVYNSVKNLNLAECDTRTGVDCIILVPSGENIEPFMEFFREKGSEAEEKGIQVWIANLEKGTIDPYIGYTTDMDIYKQFKNPRLAETVRSTWGSKPKD